MFWSHTQHFNMFILLDSLCGVFAFLVTTTVFYFFLSLVLTCSPSWALKDYGYVCRGIISVLLYLLMITLKSFCIDDFGSFWSLTHFNLLRLLILIFSVSYTNVWYNLKLLLNLFKLKNRYLTPFDADNKKIY